MWVMSTRIWLTIIGALFIVIVVLAVILIMMPTPATQPAATSGATTTEPVSSTTAATSTEPLDKSVLVTTPTPNSTVMRTFTVAGVAPGPWFFEAVFPIQVRDANGNVVGSTQGRAQGEWTTTELVTFTATVTVDPDFHGPANLVLLKDNESGLPQNDDSLEIPIVIQ